MQEQEMTDAELVDLYLAGITKTELSRLSGRSRYLVSKVVDPYKQQREEERAESIRYFWRKGLDKQDIVKQGFSYGQIDKALTDEFLAESRHERFRARFIKRIEKVDLDNGCWIWKGGLSGRGYGHLREGLAHRVSYELFVGDIDPELQIDHICNVTICVNPAHLRQVTRQENLASRTFPEQLAKRGKRSNLDSGTCANGHDVTKEGAIYEWNGKRTCQRCRIEAVGRSQERSLQAAHDLRAAWLSALTAQEPT